jgi:glutaredoxin
MIIIYTKDGCELCHKAKEYFDKLEVKYDLKNTDQDHEALADYTYYTNKNLFPLIRIGEFQYEGGAEIGLAVKHIREGLQKDK